MIYLTETRTACTETLSLLNDIAYPQQVHWFPETYSRIKTGMSYVPHKMAEKVLDATVLKTLRDNPVKTAFILAAGNAHFAGIASKALDNQLDYDYKFMPLALTQVYAGRIAQSCGATDSITTDSTACASSLKVMMDVQSLIKFYGFERVVVLTLEVSLVQYLPLKMMKLLFLVHLMRRTTVFTLAKGLPLLCLRPKLACN